MMVIIYYSSFTAASIALALGRKCGGDEENLVFMPVYQIAPVFVQPDNVLTVGASEY